jgi:uncharacterized protein YgbK (DUF1537 family)
MKNVIILADDLTGANDVGVQLLDLGLSCGSLIFKSIKKLKEEYKKVISYVDIPIIDTESRLIASNEAYKRLKNLLKFLKKYGVQQYYKKIDSTLRGNIGSEIDACIEELNLDLVPVVPAFPEMRRITVYGNHYVNGKLLENSEFADDILSPVRTSYLVDLINKQSKYKCGIIDIDVVNKNSDFICRVINRLKQDGIRILVFDCKTNKDLKNISNAIRNFKLVCGASILAKEIFKDEAKDNNNASRYQSHIILSNRVACIIGSLKQTTAKQVEYIKKRYNTYVLKISSKTLLNNTSLIKRIIFKNMKKDIIVCLSNDIDSINYISKLIRNSNMQSISKKLGEIAEYFVNELKFNKLVLSGGATAVSVCNRLNIPFLLLIKRIFTGVPLTTFQRLYIVTKPGGFGNKDALVKIFKTLKNIGGRVDYTKRS